MHKTILAMVTAMTFSARTFNMEEFLIYQQYFCFMMGKLARNEIHSGEDLQNAGNEFVEWLLKDIED